MRYVLVCLVLCVSCSMLPSWGGGGDDSNEAPKQSAVAEVMDEVGDVMVELRWWMLIALLFFPSARTAMGGMLKAFFGMFRSLFGSASAWLLARRSSDQKETR